MPEIAPMMKIQMCRQFGANVIVRGKDLAEVSARQSSAGANNMRIGVCVCARVRVFVCGTVDTEAAFAANSRISVTVAN
jgi:hypothetical protein